MRPTALLLLCVAMAAAHAADADLESREARLATRLRCVVCQNQTLAESNAPLAADMRQQIRTQLSAGRSEQDVVAFFEQRYGAFVRYDPPLRASTWLLWTAPFLLLALGLGLLLRSLAGRTRRTTTAPLDEAQRARLRALLDGDEI